MTIIDREEAIQAKQDALGKVWRSEAVPQLGLYRLVQVRDDNTSKVPQSYPREIQGYFTNHARAYEALNRYLNNSWNLGEKKEKKQERKEHAQKVEEKEAII